MKYQVIVGNLGTVLDTNNGAEAQREYGQWRRKSKANEGRTGGESVFLMRDGEIWREYSVENQDE